MASTVFLMVGQINRTYSFPISKNNANHFETALLITHLEVMMHAWIRKNRVKGYLHIYRGNMGNLWSQDVKITKIVVTVSSEKKAMCSVCFSGE